MDILLKISENTNFESLIAALPVSEYIYSKQWNHPTVLFLKGYTDTGFAEKVFHIHVRNLGYWDELYFRDYLIAHPETAASMPR